MALTLIENKLNLDSMSVTYYNGNTHCRTRQCPVFTLFNCNAIIACNLIFFHHVNFMKFSMNCAAKLILMFRCPFIAVIIVATFILWLKKRRRHGATEDNTQLFYPLLLI